MKTVEEKAEKYALERYPVTDIYDKHLEVYNIRLEIEEAYIRGYRDALESIHTSCRKNK